MFARAAPVRAAASPRSLARNATSRSAARHASTAPLRPRSGIGALAGAATGLGASLALFGVGRADDASAATGASSKAPQSAAGAWTRPVWKRDEVSTVLVIGAPSSGASTVAEAISKRFDMLLLDAESDAFTDIAKQHAMDRGKVRRDRSTLLISQKLHVVIDNFSPEQLGTRRDGEEMQC